jgi:hypothetical protein
MIDWQETIKKYSIEYLKDFPQKQPENALYVTRCCKIKTTDPEAIPKEFYKSDIVQRFIRFCETNDLNYAILSDLYGIHVKDEKMQTYDIHPSSLSEAQITHLGSLIRSKCDYIKVDTIYYYNPSPLMSIPYFRMLAKSQLKVYYLSQLKKEEKYFEANEDMFA